MSETINFEVQFFLVSILYGIILLVFYDGIRIFRRIMKHSKVFVALGDILFWLVSSVSIFAMMYEQNNGVIRGFSIMGMVIGMFAYNQLLSNLIVSKGSNLIGKFLILLKRILLLLFRPFYLAFRFLSIRLRTILLFIHRILKKCFKFLAKRLKSILKTVKISVTKD